VGEPGDGFRAEAPREVIPFIPRANEARETRNGFERGRNTGIPCVGGTGFHAVPTAPFEGGMGGVSRRVGTCGLSLVTSRCSPARFEWHGPGPAAACLRFPRRRAFGGTGGARFAGIPGKLPKCRLDSPSDSRRKI
jgi:hypothetical protein